MATWVETGAQILPFGSGLSKIQRGATGAPVLFDRLRCYGDYEFDFSELVSWRIPFHPPPLKMTDLTASCC